MENLFPNPIEIEGLVQPIRRGEGCVDLDLWSSIILAAVSARFQLHPIASQRLRASASFSVKAHVPPIPFLFVRRSTQLVNRLLNERFGLAVIAVNHVLVVV